VISGNANDMHKNMYCNVSGGSLPKDGPDPNDQSSTVAEYVIASVTASIGIISTVIFFIFNLRYSKHM